MRSLRPALALVPLLLACGRSTAEAPAPSEPPAASEPAPFAPRAMDAPALATWVASPAAKVRVVNFWATWCGPCMAEMPVLRDFERRNRSAVDLTLVNVDVASLQAGKVPGVVARLDVGHLDNVLLTARDPNAELRTHLPDWPEQIPYTLVIAPDGQVVERFVESVDGPELEAAVRRASLRRPPPG